MLKKGAFMIRELVEGFVIWLAQRWKRRKEKPGVPIPQEYQYLFELILDGSNEVLHFLDGSTLSRYGLEDMLNADARRFAEARRKIVDAITERRAVPEWAVSVVVAARDRYLAEMQAQAQRHQQEVVEMRSKETATPFDRPVH